jgi:hypothetical protein
VGARLKLGAAPADRPRVPTQRDNPKAVDELAARRALRALRPAETARHGGAPAWPASLRDRDGRHVPTNVPPPPGPPSAA